MGQKTAVGVAVVAGFVVGAVVGRVTAPPPPPNCTSLQSRTITVRADGTADCAVAWIGLPHTITWQAPSRTTLTIVLGPPPPSPNPFPQLSCQANQCESGPVAPGLFGPSDPATKEFPYTITVTGSGAPANGNARIIIKK